MTSVKVIFASMVVVLAMTALPFLIFVAALAHAPLRLLGLKGCIRQGGKHIIFDKTSFEHA